MAKSEKRKGERGVVCGGGGAGPGEPQDRRRHPTGNAALGCAAFGTRVNVGAGA